MKQGTDKSIELWRQQHSSFGELVVEICAPEPNKKSLLFTLTTIQGLRLRSFKSQQNLDTSLAFESYHRHEFQQGEVLRWQVAVPILTHSFGPWTLHAELPTEEIWEIPQLFEALTLTYDILTRKTVQLRLSIQNQTIEQLSNLTMNVEMEDSIANTYLSGISTRKMLLPMAGEENITYSIGAPGVIKIEIVDAKRYLLCRRIKITKDMFDHTVFNENRSVTVEVFENEKIIKAKNGYYNVSPKKELRIVINPNGNINEVKSIDIDHPETTFTSQGKSDDKEFAYNLKFHMNSHLTIKRIINYSVEYENSEIRPHTLAFKIKSSGAGLFILGLLFVAPMLFEHFVPSGVLFYISLIFCTCVPFLYDRFKPM